MFEFKPLLLRKWLYSLSERFIVMYIFNVDISKVLFKVSHRNFLLFMAISSVRGASFVENLFQSRTAHDSFAQVVCHKRIVVKPCIFFIGACAFKTCRNIYSNHVSLISFSALMTHLIHYFKSLLPLATLNIIYVTD